MRFLEEQTYPEIEKLSLVGIVRAPSGTHSSCFGWNTRRLDSKPFGTVLYAGSGADDLEAWLEDLYNINTRRLLHKETTSFQNALAKALSLAYMMIGTEIFGGADNLCSLYGGMMEIVSIVDGRVRRVSDVTCMF